MKNEGEWRGGASDAPMFKKIKLSLPLFEWFLAAVVVHVPLQIQVLIQHANNPEK